MKNLNEHKPSSSLILQAAKEEFAQRGYAGARLSHIAKTARCNSALLHYYFKSKETLYEAVISSVFQEDRSQYFTWVNEAHFSESQRLLASIYIIARITVDFKDPYFDRIVAWEISQDGNHRKQMIEKYFTQTIISIDNIIRDGIAKKEFKEVETTLVAWDIIHTILSYSSNREMYQHTKLGKTLYPRDASGYIYQYVRKSIFNPLLIADPVTIEFSAETELLFKLSFKRLEESTLKAEILTKS